MMSHSPSLADPDAVMRRAVRRMCEGKDTETIHRVYSKARALREHRAAMSFLTALRAPLPDAAAGARRAA